MSIRETEAGWLVEGSNGAGLFARSFSASGRAQDVSLLQPDRESTLLALAREAGSASDSIIFGMRQVHGGDVVVVEDLDNDVMPECDALVTGQSNTVLSGVTADCVPLILMAEGACGVVHAGWRGLAAGVVKRSVRVVSEAAGVDTTDIEAFVGPSAGACCYEVGEEVVREIGDSAVTQNGHLDSGDTAVRQLMAAGVAKIETVDVCTICSAPQLLNSFRRDGNESGRQGVIAWLN